ncbi:hypothetical protein D3C85_1428100 [compost metagenome]
MYDFSRDRMQMLLKLADDEGIQNLTRDEVEEVAEALEITAKKWRAELDKRGPATE